MKKSRLWIVFVAAMALLVVPAVPALADGNRGHHRPFGGEQVMALNVDLETDANLYGCDEISWFGTIELYGRTYGMALYSISNEYADGFNHYEEGWRIFTGKFRVKDGELKRCDPGHVVAAGTDVGIWDSSTGYFESVGSVDAANGRFKSWNGQTVIQDGVAPQAVSVAGLEDVPGLIGELQLAPSHGGDVDALRTIFNASERTELGNGIVHYEMEVVLGPGEYERIALHRVVEESRPYRPVRTERGIFMVHGSSLSFEPIFLPTGSDATNSSAIFLAEAGLDVWGIDLGWSAVPADTTDFTFMEGWGVGRDAEDTLSAMWIARIIRAATGQGVGPMHLLGFSYGSTVAYTAAGTDSQRPGVLRSVAALIPVDLAYKYDDPVDLERACTAQAALEARLASGEINNVNGSNLALFAMLARTDPGGQSPVVPTFTNYQFALFAGTNTWLSNAAMPPLAHFFAGVFTPEGVPVDLLYAEPEAWLSLMEALPPYMPMQTNVDIWTIACNQTDVPYDDHLGDISAPIFSIGAGGFMGDVVEYTATLTDSDDVSSLIVQLVPPEAKIVDYGHADLFMASDASTRVWTPIYDFVSSH